MELDTFIENTLASIARGVRKANTSAAEMLNDPSSRNEDNIQNEKLFRLEPGNDKKSGLGVSFDVAITTEKESATEGKGGFRVCVLGASLLGKDRSTDMSISRIQFCVSISKWID